MKKIIFLIIFTIYFLSCAIFNSYERQINNFEYPNEQIPNKKIKMTDGYFEKEFIAGFDAKIQASVVEFKEGYLNNDEIEDAVVIIAVSTTGNEIFYYLYALTGKDGNLQYIHHILLGDRIKIKLLKVMNKKIYLAFFKDTSDGPIQLKKLILGLQNNKIVTIKTVLK
ncbi:MAG: hypothetical protein N3E50_03600 [Candidatus Goldbacteria bacterium]|nr:hypothetical protein [Candidatus Goldiibacteriota bacterium]